MARTIFAAQRGVLTSAAVTALLCSALPPALAQNAVLAPVTITGKSPVPASVAGWPDVPLERAPL
jgi:hypothetical protein